VASVFAPFARERATVAAAAGVEFPYLTGRRAERLFVGGCIAGERRSCRQLGRSSDDDGKVP
jgi:hypothetical protein